MKVLIPNIATNEVKYVFHCLLEEFLGLRYEVVISDSVQDFQFIVGKEKLIVKNCFFVTDNPEEIYSVNNIPQEINKAVLKINGEEFPICSLYGKSDLTIDNGVLTLGADIVASTFFMLTRWEEAVNHKMDAHDRFAGEESIAYKNDFLDRPIVNEYVEILWALLNQLNIAQKRKIRHFNIFPTHDVDHPIMFYSKLSALKGIVRPILKFISLWDGLNYFKSFLINEDPFDTHELFMELAESAGVKSHFFFIMGGGHKYDPVNLLQHKKTVELINKVKKREHALGFHPSYEAYDNSDLFRKEKIEIEQALGVALTTGRQHYLRFKVPDTWRIWEEAGMNWDSTLGYPSLPGFRCGVCYPFPVYDFSARKKMNLFERPLIVMEVTLTNYMRLSVKEAQMKVWSLMNTIKKYRGEFVFLWHNSSVNSEKFKKYLPVLRQMYDLDLKEKPF